MHFGTILTERAGIGISWDNEAPPIYQDVPPSPPAYSHETIFSSENSIAEIIEPLDSAHSGGLSRSSTDMAGGSCPGSPQAQLPITMPFWTLQGGEEHLPAGLGR